MASRALQSAVRKKVVEGPALKREVEREWGTAKLK
jgi:hypothetical protein